MVHKCTHALVPVRSVNKLGEAIDGRLARLVGTEIGQRHNGSDGSGDNAALGRYRLRMQGHVRCEDDSDWAWRHGVRREGFLQQEDSRKIGPFDVGFPRRPPFSGI